MGDFGITPENMKELKQAAKPLHDWLCKYGHPNMIIVLDCDGVTSYEGVCRHPLQPHWGVNGSYLW